MADVTAKLLREGIEKFMEPFDALIGGIELTREGVVTGRPKTIKATLPGELEPPVIERVQRAQREDVAKRIWAHDETLWGGPGVPEIADRLGWLTISEKMLEHAGELHEFAEAAMADGLEYAVLLGMGGSSLGPEVIRRSYGEVPGGMRLHVLDSTDPGAIRDVERQVDLDKTLFIVSSKSGGTIETLSHMRYFYERTGGDGSRFCAVTDPGSPLVELARERGFRHVFENDPEIGGRYSVLSYFGLVPAACAGVNIEGMLHQAQVAEQNCAQFDSPQSNSGLWLGCVMGELAQHGRDKLTYVVSDPISSFGLWVEQLIAESTGKHGKGILPVADEPLGPAGGLRRRPRLRLPAQRGRARRRAGRRNRGARPCGPPDHHRADHRRRRGPRADLLPRRVRHRRGGLGARDQPVRPAERAGGEGQHGAHPQGGPAAARPGLARRAAGRRRAAEVHRDNGLCSAVRRTRCCGYRTAH